MCIRDRASPVQVIVSEAAGAETARVVGAVPGVESARVVDSGSGLARVDAVLTDVGGTSASEDAVRAIRTAVAGIPGADAAVGGDVAALVDQQDAAQRDQRVIAPLILVIVFLILVGLLRALVAPVILCLLYTSRDRCADPFAFLCPSCEPHKDTPLERF